MKLVEINSNKIKAVGHKDDTLFIQFQDESIYKYFNFPILVFESTIRNISKFTRAYKDEIRGHYKFELIKHDNY